MSKDNIFLEDVEVPEIVQQKADRAFFTIQTEGGFLMNDKMKKERNVFSKRIALTAACMAVVVAAGSLAGPVKGILEYSKAGSEDPLLAAADHIDKLFTLQVKAAGDEDGRMVQLEEGNPVPVTIKADKTGSWVVSGDDINESTVNYSISIPQNVCEGEQIESITYSINSGTFQIMQPENGEGIIDYCINMPQIVCEGEQIESITYSINNGAFQIVQPEDGESIIVDGQLYNGELNTGSIGGDYMDAENAEGLPSRPFETLFYKSFTLNYDRQSDEYTWINICNECSDSEEIVQLIWNEEGSEEKYNSGVQKMLDNTVITCRVHYKDYTSQSAGIIVNSHIMTRREAGELLDEGIDPEEKITVITFELATVRLSDS